MIVSPASVSSQPVNTQSVILPSPTPKSSTPDSPPGAAAQAHRAALLQPQGHLHLQQGPIDLVIGVEGSAELIDRAYQVMNKAFSGVLAGLVAELPQLRQPVTRQLRQQQRRVEQGITSQAKTDRSGSHIASQLKPSFESELESPFSGAIATVMWQRCQQIVTCCEQNSQMQALTVPLTPMAGVAGAVAEYVLAAGRTVKGVSKIWVNNGGDIALYLDRHASFDCGIAGLENAAPVEGRRKIRIAAVDAISGIATSGRHGRSLSMGIADAVTVLATDAVTADIAATLIANAVDLPGHRSIQRVCANELDPDSDLGQHPVVVELGSISTAECRRALACGAAIADHLIQTGYIRTALLALRGEFQIVGHDPSGSRQAC